ncbi:MAG: fused MFS/spermidine synthase, partial [Planctomycetota bacterium]
MFFQWGVLAGYSYAHLVRSFLSPRISFLIHTLLCGASLITVQFGFHSDPIFSTSPMLDIFVKLLIGVGAPVICLSATSPLFQAWFHLEAPTKDNYRLYVFSNCGSLLALFSYPILVEQTGLQSQQLIWLAGFAVYMAVTVLLQWRILLYSAWQSETRQQNLQPRPKLSTVTVWACLSMIGSMILMSISNLLCREVASSPFLWILPLAMYLLTMIICFDHPRWYSRNIICLFLMPSIFGSVLLYHLGTNAPLLAQAIGFSAVTFFSCMLCHGELCCTKPPPNQLTWFYFAVSLGGALGGTIISFGAPRLFDGYYEFHAAILACLTFTTILIVQKLQQGIGSRLSLGYIFLACVSALPVVCSLYFVTNQSLIPGLIVHQRNEYGTISIAEQDGYRKMFNGQTNHGGQFTDPEREFEPSAYYSRNSGIDLAFRVARNSKPNSSGLHVGIVGLGTGAMLCYQDEPDRFRFYEINPLAEPLARKYFSFLNRPGSKVITGDGRQLLEKELESIGSHQFDLLFLDAFSSDSIPVHLLTREAIELYLSHLHDDGILVFHVTNKFLDLRTVVKNTNESLGLTAAYIEHFDEEFNLRTKWVLVSRNGQFADSNPILNHRIA